MQRNKNLVQWSRSNLTPTALGQNSHTAWTVDKNDVTVVRFVPVTDPQKKQDATKDLTASETNSEPLSLDISHILEKFAHGTTIQGVSQITTRKGFLWKFIWFCISVCGACMAVYQSRDVIRDYYGDSIIQKLSFKSKDAPFPAVTVCKTMRTKQTESSVGSEEDADLDVSVTDINNINDSLNYIRRCKFGTATCNLSNPDDIFPWINPKYGSCFTFNPGFRIVKELDTASVLNLLIDMHTSAETSQSTDYTIVAIHQSGTPPILHHTRYTTINAKDLYSVKLKARELIKLKDSKDCVKPQDKRQTKALVYHTEATPYIFTTLICQKSCEVNRRIRRTNCLDPAVVINVSSTQSINRRLLRFCNYTEVSYDVDQDYRRPCVCPFACRETLLEEASMSRTATTCKQSNVNESNTETLSCAVIKVSYGNVPYEIIQEQRKYSDADFWGIIGGNIGLWVGICIISLLELFELAANLILCLWKHRHFLRRRKIKSKKPAINPHYSKAYPRKDRQVLINPRRNRRY